MEYGQDPTYGNSGNTVMSGGSITTITINETKPVAYFTFTGTGFELIGRTNAVNSDGNSSATLSVVVKDSSGKIVRRVPVINEFDNGADGGTEVINQVPVIRIELNDLEKASYTVEITGVRMKDYENPDDDGNPTVIPTKVYVDGLRIFQPLGATNENYNDAENGAVVSEIRDLITNAKVAVASYDGASTTVSTGTITWTENRNGETYDGKTYTGNQVSSVNDYLTLGPNNEVYMDGTHSTAALVFYVKENAAADENESLTYNLQVAVRGIDSGLFYGSNSTGVETVVKYGTTVDGEFAWESLATVKSSTEQYYTIDYTKCPYIEGKGYQVAIYTESGFASYSSLKYNNLTIDENIGEAATLQYVDGVLTKIDNGTATALDEGDYLVFYSIRQQLLTLSAAPDEGEDVTPEEGTTPDEGETETPKTETKTEETPIQEETAEEETAEEVIPEEVQEEEETAVEEEIIETIKDQEAGFFQKVLNAIEEFFGILFGWFKK